jgi:hypothetical protein
MKRSFFFSGLLACLLALSLLGAGAVQAGKGSRLPTTRKGWAKSFWCINSVGNGSGYNSAISAQQTSDGGVIAGGFLDDWPGIWKLDSRQNLQWSKITGSSTNFLYRAGNPIAAASATGEYFLAGSYGGTLSTGNYVVGWVAKVSAIGNQVWMVTAYSLFPGSVLVALQATADGGCVVAGTTVIPDITTYSNVNIWVIKLDANGSVQWQNTYGGLNYNTEARGITTTADGGYALTGTIQSQGSGIHWLVLKLDHFGNVMWQKAVGYDGYYNYPASIHATPDGGYILCGSAGYNAAEPRTGSQVMLKLDGEGNVQWQKSCGEINDKIKSIISSPDGGYIATGTYITLDSMKTEVWVFKVNAQGAIQWSKTYGGSNGQGGYDITTTHDGGFLVAAVSASIIPGKSVAWLLKLPTNGNLVFNRTSNVSQQDYTAPVGDANMTASTPNVETVDGTVSTYGGLTGVIVDSGPITINTQAP